MTGTLAAIILLGAAVGIGWMMFKKKAKEPEKTAPPPEPARTDADEFREIMDSLLGLNLMMRKDPALSPDMTREIESIIDDLRSVIPPMMKQYPGEALTYELKKIGLTHLKKIVKEFLDLSPESRKAQDKIFKNSVQSLGEVTQRSRQIIENNETAEFKTMAHFLAGKFS
ncbi:hypothetical protein [Desulfospira joergensenii]|uniref:hypothetical protein n=1 Tax=Desulfospira joergensenii TaxID=53329 RepID=UPI0003B31C43|nr:hypothetical protein [Desulfospira joergensenii]